MRTRLTAACALLSAPQAACFDPGPGCCEQQPDRARTARGHVRSLERLGWKVPLEPIGPGTGDLITPAG